MGGVGPLAQRYQRKAPRMRGGKAVKDNQKGTNGKSSLPLPRPPPLPQRSIIRSYRLRPLLRRHPRLAYPWQRNRSMPLTLPIKRNPRLARRAHDRPRWVHRIHRLRLKLPMSLTRPLRKPVLTQHRTHKLIQFHNSAIRLTSTMLAPTNLQPGESFTNSLAVVAASEKSSDARK